MTRLCWSFCTPDCTLRKHNGCRKSIPQYDLASPNEGADHILYLRWGKQDYDDHPEVKQYGIELRKWIAGDRVGPRPIHWRQRVGDKWAGICIWEDPDVSEEVLKENGYSRPKLYDPWMLNNLLLSTPRIIKVVHFAVEQDGESSAMRRVHKELLSFFRNEFKQEWLAWAVSTGKKLEVEAEPAWASIFKFLERATELIGNWLLLNYELFPQEWSVNVIKYGEPSPQWIEHLKKVAEVGQPRKIQRLTIVDDEVLPKPIKGLILED